MQDLRKSMLEQKETMEKDLEIKRKEMQANLEI